MFLIRSSGEWEVLNTYSDSGGFLTISTSVTGMTKDHAGFIAPIGGYTTTGISNMSVTIDGVAVSQDDIHFNYKASSGWGYGQLYCNAKFSANSVVNVTVTLSSSLGGRFIYFYGI